MKHMQKLIVFCLAAVIWPLSATASNPTAVSAAEMTLLPPYCKARLGKDPAGRKRWKRSFGTDFTHLHHYCYGINQLNRARGMSSRSAKRKEALQKSWSEFTYILQHTSRRFRLKAETYYYMGEIERLRGNHAAALAQYQAGVKARKRFPHGWAGISDMYIKTGKRALAREALEKGLKQSPRSKLLKRRMEELGHAPAKPAAVEKEPAKEPAAAEQAADQESAEVEE